MLPKGGDIDYFAHGYNLVEEVVVQSGNLKEKINNYSRHPQNEKLRGLHQELFFVYGENLGRCLAETCVCLLVQTQNSW